MRALRLLIVASLVLAFAALPATAGAAPLFVEAVNENVGIYGTNHWSNAEQTITSGEKVTFRNPYPGLPYHGLRFTGPAPSVCSGIPAGEAGAPNWEGECTFTNPGAYTFVCTVHPSEMKGTIVVPGTPTATTGAQTEVTQTGAKLNGTVKPEGNATEYRFEYGVATVAEHATSTLGTGSADFTGHPVSAQLTGLLSPGVTYHFRLVAIYGAGKTTVLGGEQTFTTPTPTAPTVKVGTVTSLKETEATLNGTVDPNAGEATEYFFEYGTTPSFGASTVVKSLPVDVVNHAVSGSLSNLTPGTLYYYKLVATNKVGQNSAEGAFKTSSPPPPPPEQEQTPPAPPTTTPPSTTPPLVTPLPVVEEGFKLGPVLVAGSAKFTSPRHGSTVRGSVQVGQGGAGGRLEVDLTAKGSLLAKTRSSKRVRVGRLIRRVVDAGKLSFSVTLTTQGKRALTHRHSLPITVTLVLTPAQGAASTLTRSLTLRS